MTGPQPLQKRVLIMRPSASCLNFHYPLFFLRPEVGTYVFLVVVLSHLPFYLSFNNVLVFSSFPRSTYVSSDCWYANEHQLRKAFLTNVFHLELQFTITLRKFTYFHLVFIIHINTFISYYLILLYYLHKLHYIQCNKIIFSFSYKSVILLSCVQYPVLSVKFDIHIILHYCKYFVQAFY
jgi:hypothetical protein